MKKLIVALALIVVTALGVATLGVYSIPVTKSSIEKLDFTGSDLVANQQFCTEFKKAGSDNWLDLGCRKNTITNVGLNHVEFMMGTGANSPVKYLALGNSTTVAVGDTTLGNEQTDCGLNRATGTTYDLGNGWWEVNNTFTYSCTGSRKVNTTANFNASSSGVLYAGGTISDVTFTTNGDQLKLRHNFTLTEG